MKKIVLLLMFIPLVSFGQNQEAMKLCIDYRNSINSFVSDSEADDALHKIISVIGASTNFILQSCNDINNALAVTYKGNRYILYDKNFMQELNYKSNNWTSMFILAHEIGHHINGHTRELTISKYLDPQSLSKEREEELEADEFAGFILANLGASYDQAIKGISLIAPDRDSRTHPNKTKRINAIKIGFNKAKKNPIEIPNNPNDIIRYTDGSRWEGPVKKITKIADEISTDAEGNLVRKTSTKKVPYGKGIYIYNDGRVYEGYWYDGLLKRETNTSKKSSSTNLNNANNIYKRGNAKFNLKDYYGAIADYTKAIELKPDLGGPLGNRGLAKYRLKDYYGAIADYTKAIELHPNNANNIYNRGLAKNNLEDYYGAIADYTKAIELKPDYTTAYSNRGVAKGNVEDYSGAIADFTKAIELRPKHSMSYSNRAWYKISIIDANNDDYYSAISDCNKALEIDPDNDLAYNNRGDAKNKLGDLKGACSDWEIASKMGNEFAQDSIKKFCN